MGKQKDTKQQEIELQKAEKVLLEKFYQYASVENQNNEKTASELIKSVEKYKYELSQKTKKQIFELAVDRTDEKLIMAMLNNKKTKPDAPIIKELLNSAAIYANTENKSKKEALNKCVKHISQEDINAVFTDLYKNPDYISGRILNYIKAHRCPDNKTLAQAFAYVITETNPQNIESFIGTMLPENKDLKHLKNSVKAEINLSLNQPVNHHGLEEKWKGPQRFQLSYPEKINNLFSTAFNNGHIATMQYLIENDRDIVHGEPQDHYKIPVLKSCMTGILNSKEKFNSFKMIVKNYHDILDGELIREALINNASDFIYGTTEGDIGKELVQYILNDITHDKLKLTQEDINDAFTKTASKHADPGIMEFMLGAENKNLKPDKQAVNDALKLYLNNEKGYKDMDTINLLLDNGAKVISFPVLKALWQGNVRGLRGEIAKRIIENCYNFMKHPIDTIKNIFASDKNPKPDDLKGGHIQQNMEIKSQSLPRDSKGNSRGK